MAINSNLLGATTISGDEAKAFSRMVRRGVKNRIVSQAARDGRKMATSFAKAGVVTIELKTSVR